VAVKIVNLKSRLKRFCCQTQLQRKATGPKSVLAIALGFWHCKKKPAKHFFLGAHTLFDF